MPFKNMIKKIFLLILVLVLSEVCLVWGAVKEIAELVDYVGRVSVLKGGKLPAKRVKIGMKFYEKDVIRTKTGAKAVIRFIDGNILRIGERTRVDLVEYFKHKKGIVRVPRGSVKVDINRTEWRGKHFEVITPVAVAGVRGTSFVVLHDPVRMLSSIAVLKGKVYTYNPQFPKRIIVIPAGKITIVKPNTPPLPPKQISSQQKMRLEELFKITKGKEEKGKEVEEKGKESGISGETGGEREVEEVIEKKKPAEEEVVSPKEEKETEITGKEEVKEETPSASEGTPFQTLQESSEEVTPPITENEDVNEEVSTEESAEEETNLEITISNPSIWFSFDSGERGISFLISANKEVTLYDKIDDEDWQEIGNGTGINFSSGLSELSKGFHTLQIKAVDSEGNEQIQTLNLEIYGTNVKIDFSGDIKDGESDLYFISFNKNNKEFFSIYAPQGNPEVSTFMGGGGTIDDGLSFFKVESGTITNFKYLTENFIYSSNSGNIESTDPFFASGEGQKVDVKWGFKINEIDTNTSENTYFLALSSEDAIDNARLSFVLQTEGWNFKGAGFKVLNGTNFIGNIEGYKGIVAGGFDDNGRNLEVLSIVKSGDSLGILKLTKGDLSVCNNFTTAAGELISSFESFADNIGNKTIDITSSEVYGNAFFNGSGVSVSFNPNNNILEFFMPTIDNETQNWGILAFELGGSSVPENTFKINLAGKFYHASYPFGYWLFEPKEVSDFSNSSVINLNGFYITELGAGQLNGTFMKGIKDDGSWEGVVSAIAKPKISFTDGGWVGDMYFYSTSGMGLIGYGKDENGNFKIVMGGWFVDNNTLSYSFLNSGNFYSCNYLTNEKYSYDNRWYEGFVVLGYSEQNKGFIGNYLGFYYDNDTKNIGIIKGNLNAPFYLTSLENENTYYFYFPEWSYEEYGSLDNSTESLAVEELSFTENITSSSTILNIYQIDTDLKFLSGLNWGIGEIGIKGNSTYDITSILSSGSSIPINVTTDFSAEYGQVVVYGITNGSNGDIINSFPIYGAFTNPQKGIDSAIFVGETVGVVSDLTSQTGVYEISLDAPFVWFETSKFLDMVCPRGTCSTDTANLNSVQKELLDLGVPVVEVGRVNFSGGGDTFRVDMNNVHFFATQAGTRPTIWLTNQVNGNIIGTVSVGDSVDLTASAGGTLVGGATFTITNWDTTNNKWNAHITGTVDIGNIGTVDINGVAGGSINTSAGTFSGSAAGVAKDATQNLLY